MLAPLSMASPEQNQSRDPFNERPRLPSFSNFLNAAGRLDGPFDRRNANSSFVNRPASFPSDTKFPSPLEHAPPSESLFNPSYSRQTLSTDHSNIGRLPEIGHQSSSLRPNPKISTLSEPFSSPTSLRQSAPSILQNTIPLLEGSRTRVVVGEEVIPGKGLCYRYDDGSICPKVINGDTVNPDWGTTKTGKPRKRLGQACNTCREKKIKCDPSLPKCQQCQKFGRECKFAATSRSSQKNPAAHSPRESIGTATALTDRSIEAKDVLGSSADASPHERLYSRSASKSSIAVDSLLSPPSTGNPHEEDEALEAHRAAKKLRVYTDSPENKAREISIIHRLDPDASPETKASSSQTQQRFHIGVDPYEVERELTTYYLSNYFVHINASAYTILPRRLFIKWVKENRTKSKWDRALLYAMIALGAIFGKEKDSHIHCETCLTIAEEALAQTSGIFEIQIVLTRFVVSLTAFSQGQASKSWELGGATIRAATGMNLNIEKPDDTWKQEMGPLAFDFDFPTLAECKRRTFWSAYVMDCFNGAFSGHVLSINKADCFLRLPCQEVSFEAGQAQEMPYFHQHLYNEPSSKTNSYVDFGMMTFLVQIATTFSDIVNRINRSKFQTTERHEPAVDVFYPAINRQIQQWEKVLKKTLVLSPPDHALSAIDMPPETISGLHLLYHYSAMLLHRHVRYEDMNSTLIARNVQGAYNHARRTLEILQRLTSHGLRDIPPIRFAAYSPLTAYVAITAIDILTAAGAVSEFLEIQNRSIELVAGGIEVLDILAEHWQPAKALRDQVKERISAVFAACKSGSALKKKAFFVPAPLISPFGMDLDMIYGLPRVQYLQALGLGKRVTSVDDLHKAGGNSNTTSSI